MSERFETLARESASVTFGVPTRGLGVRAATHHEAVRVARRFRSLGALRRARRAAKQVHLVAGASRLARCGAARGTIGGARCQRAPSVPERQQHRERPFLVCVRRFRPRDLNPGFPGRNVRFKDYRRKRGFNHERRSRWSLFHPRTAARGRVDGPPPRSRGDVGRTLARSRAPRAALTRGARESVPAEEARGRRNGRGEQIRLLRPTAGERVSGRGR